MPTPRAEVLLASLDEVEGKLEELLGRLEQTDREIRGSLPEGRILTVRIPDLDADYWTEMAEGRMGPLQVGHRGDAHISIVVDSDPLLELIDGRADLLPAFLTGKIRVQASFSDLMLMKKLFT